MAIRRGFSNRLVWTKLSSDDAVAKLDPNGKN